MPRVATTINDAYESITRPVAVELARQLSGLMPLPSNIALVFPGASEEVAMPGSTLGFEGERNRFGSEARLRIEIEETTEEDHVLATSTFQKEHHPIFVDSALGIRLHPIYSTTELVLNCTFRAPNRVTAIKFREDALIRSAMVREQEFHEITYNYGLPHSYLFILKYLYGLREAVAGYGDTFDQWVSDHITLKATNLLTLDGKQQELVVAETQSCVLGFFDFAAKPEPEQKDQDTGPWVVNFNYRVRYDKVIGCTMQWPLIVHNQLVDPTLHGTRHPIGEQADPARRKRRPSISRHAFDAMGPKLKREPCHRTLDGVIIPEFDEWSPASVQPATSSLFSIMLTVDPADPNALLNLGELGDYEIDPVVLDWLKTEAPYLHRPTQSVFLLTLYREEHPLEPTAIKIDRDLNVRSVEPLDLRSRYHLRIALLNDLKQLPATALDRFRTSGQACLTVLQTLQWRLLGLAKMPALLGGTTVARRDILDIATRLNDLKYPHHTGVEYRMLTVGNAAVVARRKSDLRSEPDAHRELETGNPTGPGTDPTQGDTVALPRCDG